MYHLLLSLLLPAAAAAALPLVETPGPNTWAFIVSVLEYKDAASYEGYAKGDRRDAELVRFLREERGVPADHIVWLKDSEATRAALKKRLGRLLTRSKAGDLLYFYYAGHGERRKPGSTFFVPYDGDGDAVGKTAWPVSEALALIEARFKGDRAVLAADSCHSGGLCKEAAAQGRRISYACFASAHPSSGSTGAWTFSDAFLGALSGGSRADLDGDGVIAVGELASRVEGEMAAREGQLSDWAATGALSAAAPLAGVRRRDPEVALPPTAARLHADGAKVSAEWDGDWYDATVTGFKLGLHRVTYDGWSAYWDEWVPRERLRAR